MFQGSEMPSDELMRLLIPDGDIEKYAKVSGLSKSLLYQERRPFSNDFKDTGTRNTIARLDIYSELTLSRNPIVVRMLGERYLNLYNNFFTPQQKYTKADLLVQLGKVAKECGEAMSVLSGQKSMKECCVEVAQAKEALEAALAIVAAIEDCDDK